MRTTCQHPVLTSRSERFPVVKEEVPVPVGGECLWSDSEVVTVLTELPSEFSTKILTYMKCLYLQNIYMTWQNGELRKLCNAELRDTTAIWDISCTLEHGDVDMDRRLWSCELEQMALFWCGWWTHSFYNSNTFFCSVYDGVLEWFTVYRNCKFVAMNGER